jgi:general secretion pathway protein I
LTRKWTNEGFTLLEVLIALGLIAIALFAVFHLQAQNLDLVTEAQFQTQARFLAQDRLSRIEARPTMESGRGSGDFEEISPHFFYEEEIRSAGEPEGLYSVQIDIAWEQGSRKRVVTGKTCLFSRPGM